MNIHRLEVILAWVVRPTRSESLAQEVRGVPRTEFVEQLKASRSRTSTELVRQQIAARRSRAEAAAARLGRPAL